MLNEALQKEKPTTWTTVTGERGGKRQRATWVKVESDAKVIWDIPERYVLIS